MKRKNYIINKKFQYSIISKFILLALFNNFIFFLTGILFFKNLKSEAIDLGLTKGHVFFDFLSQIKIDYISFIVIAAIISSIIILIAGIFISHRIAGPLYRLNQHFQSTQNINDLQPVKFRKKDYFREVELSFNQMIEKIKKYT